MDPSFLGSAFWLHFYGKYNYTSPPHHPTFSLSVMCKYKDDGKRKIRMYKDDAVAALFVHFTKMERDFLTLIFNLIFLPLFVMKLQPISLVPHHKVHLYNYQNPRIEGLQARDLLNMYWGMSKLRLEKIANKDLMDSTSTFFYFLWLSLSLSKGYKPSNHLTDRPLEILPNCETKVSNINVISNANLDAIKLTRTLMQ